MYICNILRPSSSLSVHITPSTADDKDKQFVYVVAMVTTDTEVRNINVIEYL